MPKANSVRRGGAIKLSGEYDDNEEDWYNDSSCLPVMSKWRYIPVECQCGASKSIRIDQFNRNGGLWTCMSCVAKRRIESRKEAGLNIGKASLYGSGLRSDPVYKGCYSSYCKAKYRVKVNHRNAYKNIEFRFESFDQWFAELGPRPDGMSVDRIDNEGHYEPGNVRWATAAEQCRNRSNNVIVEYNGVKMCMTDAAKASGIPYGTLEKRIRSNCPSSHLFIKGYWRHGNGALAPLDKTDKELW